MQGYRLHVMRFPRRTFGTAVAAGMSLWMAALACLIGCTLPSFANFGLASASSIQQNSAVQSQADLMADMPNCPHHSTSNTPGKQDDRKPVPGGRMSCCPVEVTVASKPNTLTPHLHALHGFVLQSNFSLTAVRFLHSVESVPLSRRSGRDTLLATQLLRI
jgi:hypothetical protein